MASAGLGILVMNSLSRTALRCGIHRSWLGATGGPLFGMASASRRYLLSRRIKKNELKGPEPPIHIDLALDISAIEGLPRRIWLHSTKSRRASNQHCGSPPKDIGVRDREWLLKGASCVDTKGMQKCHHVRLSPCNI